MIEINHLVKKYGNQLAVNDLSLTVEPGKIYGFLGPNGAGKSTTMNIITGYIGATSGEVKINGHDIFKEPEEAKKAIGYLPELPPLYMDMTVYEYLKFVADLKKLDKSKKAQLIEQAMKLTQVMDVKNRMIKNLSKGYRQRVGFAQAVLGFPEVIILDEPTVGLDPKQIIEVRDLIKKLGEEHTVILSSHILQEISAVCDHIFIIAKGKLVASDTTEHLMEQMGGAQELSFELKGDKSAIEAILKSVSEIDTYTMEDGKTDGEFHVVVEAKQSADLRETMARKFAEKQVLIFSMQESTKSLEDVFLELTSQETPSEDLYAGINKKRLLKSVDGALDGSGNVIISDDELEKEALEAAESEEEKDASDL